MTVLAVEASFPHHHPRLPVVAPKPAARPRQDCARCRCLPTCWDQNLDAHGITINLLVCRIERNLGRDRATRTLLKMLHPAFLKRAKRMVQTIGTSGHASIDELVAEMQAVAIETLMTQYAMGERLHPLRWLFGEPNGAITRWAIRYTNAIRREAGVFYHYGEANSVGAQLGDPFDLETEICRINFAVTGGRIAAGPADLVITPLEYDADAAAKEQNSHALDYVEDGVTLPVAEYRALAFCLANAREDSQVPLTGIHKALGKRAGAPRKTIGRFYNQALRRVIDTSGQTAAYFKRLGLEIPRSALKRRRARQLQVNYTTSLTADEICCLLELKRTKKASVQDLAWLYGVCEDFIYRISRRFEGLSDGEIRAICNR